jgi:serine/threonine protein kinase
MSDCPPDERFARLVDGQLSDDEVHALEAHADACPSCTRVLAELARTVAPEPADWLGERYRLLEPLGAGGMGVVYAALDDKLGRKVAVKRLRESAPGSSAERRRARFLREAQLLASLSHPNVLTVFDVGGGERDLYVVMELVDGWPVSRWVVETDPDWRRIVDVYLQAGRGLAAAHELGIVHRDVKPDNILVARSGRVLVGDFGLAGLTDTVTPIESPPSPAAPLTQTGAVLGTPAYMSPEQHAGKPGDAFSDQFSFCVALYETLHGRRPFAGRTASEIAAATREGALAPGRDGVPRVVDRVLAAGLDPTPARRFPSMAALLAALERARAARPRRRLAVGLAAVAAIGAAGVAIAGLGRLPPRSQKIARIAPVPATQPAAPGGGSPDAGIARLLAPAPVPAPAPVAPPPAAPRLPRSVAKRAPDAPKQVALGDGPPLDADAALVRAAEAADHRDGTACLAALDAVASWPAELVRRTDELRADCEMLRGNCELGRTLLEPIYASDRTIGSAARGLLRARVARMCPPATFATVNQRIRAVYLQADIASQSPEKHPRWCGALERQLFADTRSHEIQDCFRASAAGRPPPAVCVDVRADLVEAYRYLSECFLRDGNCGEGAILDLLHGQVEMQSVASDDVRRTEEWCRGDAVRERYERCADAGREAERRCQAEVAAARAAGRTLTPVLPR